MMAIHDGLKGIGMHTSAHWFWFSIALVACNHEDPRTSSIVERLDKIEKRMDTVDRRMAQAAPQAPRRPDPKVVYNPPVGDGSVDVVHGPRTAKVTIVE